MRLGVLATRETYVDEDEQEEMIDQGSESAAEQRAPSAAIATGSGTSSSTAAGKPGAAIASWTAGVAPSLRGAKRHDGTGVRSAAVAATSLVPQTLLRRRRELFAPCRAPTSEVTSAMSSAALDEAGIDEAGLVCLFNLKRGHEIVQPADGLAPVTAPSGQIVISIDNTRSIRTFVAWARQHFGRAGRSVLHPVCVDPQPSTVALAMSIQHAPGTRLLVLREGALLDVTVERCAGPEYGNRHTLRPAGSPDSPEARLEVDLNELNHSTQRFGSAGAFEAARRRYLERTLQRGALVEDAITGRFLKIAEQLLNLTMATGGEAVRDEVRAEGGLAEMADADLVWTLGEADLQPGDRVRHRGRLGHIGFRNGDGRRVFLGSATADASKRFYCGCAVGNEVCGGKLRDGSGPSCASCRSFTRENAEVLRSELTDPRLHHVEFDHASASQCKRALCLAYELEKARPISGVHRDEWNGCAFRNGDVVYVEDGFVTHATSKKRVGLAYAYRPLRLSPLLNARTNTIEIEDGHVARRVRGQGGCVIGAEPLVFIDGVATFEVVIKRYSGSGDEGLEVGVTTTKPEDIELATRGYAASVSPSWFSSDSGSLWINGHPLYHHGQWQQTRPTALKAGDVVTVHIKASGHFEIYCNGLFQTCWAAAQVPTDRPLYPVFGLRAPACAIATRLRDAKLDGLPKGRRAITLRGIEGRLGELIDLSKHGRPRYPATFLNVRSLTDIQSLAPLLYAPWAKREQGCKGT
ncbi:hypothetical protein Ctob_010920 [Chrysochromulina tobinii]|uniref:NHR domain-containing protein n=1 Tax=Chrysochromulina tobinii TaxID=1460289 RepID=A0A0M0JX94_9EUKA|nr:hypothetical protein Ctob_010920 [Chrysochromulina tobinii]|eukprot:KOO30937.1 hypothetical protein Ctob_010920 [Chrysochromulina sp. CCMP291]